MLTRVVKGKLRDRPPRNTSRPHSEAWRYAYGGSEYLLTASVFARLLYLLETLLLRVLPDALAGVIPAVPALKSLYRYLLPTPWPCPMRQPPSASELPGECSKSRDTPTATSRATVVKQNPIPLLFCRWRKQQPNWAFTSWNQNARSKPIGVRSETTRQGTALITTTSLPLPAGRSDLRHRSCSGQRLPDGTAKPWFRTNRVAPESSAIATNVERNAIAFGRDLVNPTPRRDLRRRVEEGYRSYRWFTA